MMFYIDYLDYLGSSKINHIEAKKWLRYDLLIFNQDALCLSAPACVKLANTTQLLSDLDVFWKMGHIKIQLDKKHKCIPMNYFNSRKKKLESTLSESKLLQHFEYQAYTSNRVDTFYNTYLGDFLNIDRETVFIPKCNDTDALFRRNVITDLNDGFNDFVGILAPHEQSRVQGILYTLDNYASSPYLFQRSIICESLDQKFKLSPTESLIVNNILDHSFAIANAKTSLAVPLTLVTNQITGRWLASLLNYSNPSLHRKIMSLSWDQVYSISKTYEWEEFVKCLNSLIFLLQMSHKKELDSIAHHICHFKTMYQLVSWLINQIAKKASQMATISNTYYDYSQIKDTFKIYTELASSSLSITLKFIGYFEACMNSLEAKLDHLDKFDLINQYHSTQLGKGFMLKEKLHTST